MKDPIPLWEPAVRLGKIVVVNPANINDYFEPEQFKMCKVCHEDWDKHDEACPIPTLIEWSGIDYFDWNRNALT